MILTLERILLIALGALLLFAIIRSFYYLGKADGYRERMARRKEGGNDGNE